MTRCTSLESSSQHRIPKLYANTVSALVTLLRSPPGNAAVERVNVRLKYLSPLIFVLVNVSAGLCGGTSALGQTLIKPQESSSPVDIELLRLQERQEAERARLQPPVNVRVDAIEVSTQDLLANIPKDESPCFSINQVNLTGSDGGQFLWLLNHLAGSKNDDSPLRKCVGAAGINVLLKRVQNVLIDRGFVTSRVLAQPQDISQGTLLLSVIAGRIRDIRYSQPDGQRNPSLATLPLRSGSILNLRNIEQAH